MLFHQIYFDSNIVEIGGHHYSPPICGGNGLRRFSHKPRSPSDTRLENDKKIV